ncbi:uncharacterized protein LOC132753066 [Ruditapes philippinarum]|uniref:uncharacterized protein LOC132753066 n=1 Tax=Ruditapes philippinarum TaxID=129788 RepID=UPI00295A846C|nr:uncharacterized protein LOC132753066 [Ruditapes philippinarum]
MAQKADTLQRLLWSGEYKILEDEVLAEGEFLEFETDHVRRLVLLGMTANNLIIAKRHITNYKHDPEVYYLTDVDLDLDGLEVSSVLPVCLIGLDSSCYRYELIIRVLERTRYYELTNTHINGDIEQTWKAWLERILYLKEDPDGYIRAQCEQYEIPYPDYYVIYEKSPVEPADDTLIWKLLDLDAVEMLETALKKRQILPEKRANKKSVKEWRKNSDQKCFC